MMRAKIITAVAAVLLTITAGVLAQTSGFPSRPKFQAVGVGMVAGTTGTLSVSNIISVPEIRADDGSVVIRLAHSGGANYLQSYDSALTAPQALIVQASEVSVTAAGGLAVNGLAVPRIARALMSDASGTCSLSNNSGFTSCTHSVTGAFNINMTAAGFSATPVCSATAAPSSHADLRVVGIFVSSATVATVFISANGGAAVNGNAQVVCFGS